MWEYKRPTKYLQDYMDEVANLIHQQTYTSDPVLHRHLQKKINSLMAEVRERYGDKEKSKNNV